MSTTSNRRRNRLANQNRRGYTPRSSPYWPFIPTDILRELIRPALLEHGITNFAALCKVSPREINHILTDYEKVSFHVADKLISVGLEKPDLWLTNPVLNAVYQQVDE